jgi:hypothetical protein
MCMKGCWNDQNHNHFHPVKIGVWSAVSCRSIFGFYFFENTINSGRCFDIVAYMNSSVTSLKRKLPKQGSNKAVQHVSTGDCGRDIAAVRRLSHYERSLASTLAECVTTRFISVHSAYRNKPCSVDHVQCRWRRFTRDSAVSVWEHASSC